VGSDLDLILARAAERGDDVLARMAAAYACDRTGREDDAIRHYDAAWRLGVPEEHRRRFAVGYGSTLRCVGRLEESVAILGEAIAEDPGYAPFKAFLALSLHAMGERSAAIAAMLDALLDVAGGASLDGYEQALTDLQRELLDDALARR
jgi:tetratricopeptide (TPR) repeat protein